MASERAARWVVVGSYPPVPGLPAAATVAAVRRIWDGGGEAVVASPRPSAAQHHWRVRGIAAGHRLDQLRRKERATAVVLCAERSMPWRAGLDSASTALARRVSVELARACKKAAHAELVVTGELGVSLDALAPLWGVLDRVIADSDATAQALRIAGAPRVEVASLGAADPLLATVYGPREVKARERPRQAISIAARAVLGRHAPVVRKAIVSVVRQSQRQLRARRPPP